MTDDEVYPVIKKWVGFFFLGVIALWLLGSVPVFMGTGQVGVVTNFNRVTGKEFNEGLNFKLPWPIEQVHDFDVRVQKEQVDASAASVDLQEVSAKLAVNYHLDRAQVSKIYQTIGTDYKSRLVDPAIQESFKAATAKYTVTELLTKRQEVKEAAHAILASRLEPRGILIDDILIVNFDFSPQFNKAIEQAQVAKQQVIQAQNELAKVKVEAEQKVAQAEADAKAQQLKRESLTPELVELQWIQKWDGKLPQYQLGGSTPLIQIPGATQ